MRLAAVKHLQHVLALVVLSGVQDLHPDLVHGAASLGPDVLVNPFVPVVDGIGWMLLLSVPLMKLEQSQVRAHTVVQCLFT